MTKDEFNATLGAIIRKRRKELGWTLEEVGRNVKLNFSKVTLSTIERGEQGLSVFHFFLLCDVLKIKIEDLQKEVFQNISSDIIIFTSEKDDKKIVLEVK